LIFQIVFLEDLCLRCVYQTGKVRQGRAAIVT